MSVSELIDLLEKQALQVRRLECELQALNARVRIVEHNLPVMLAFVDVRERYLFHNEAYRRWLGLRAEQIDGRTKREVLGESTYAEIADGIKRALSGTWVSYEHTHVCANGTRRLSGHMLPYIDETQVVAGVYCLLLDPQVMTGASGEVPALLGCLDAEEDAPDLHEGEVARSQNAWREASERIRTAIRNDEFHLYSQAIRDLTTEVPPFYSIFVRQAEEETNRMSPGSFFATAEEYGLMSEFDRWVVRGVLDWIRGRMNERAAWRPSLYSINLSRDSIGDPYFPDFVQEQLVQTRVPAEAMCFEFQETDVAELRVDTAELVGRLQSFGCRTMLGGVGREHIPVQILKDMHFDFLKIDGSLVLNVLRNDASASRLRSIVRLAHTLGINTIAELVESREVLEKLRELEVDYAQGDGIAPVLPLRGKPAIHCQRLESSYA